jgi:hypothetical protein
VVTVWVGWDHDTSAPLWEKGLQTPATIPVPMLIDTGATISSISHEAIQALGLVPRDTIQLRTASNSPTESRPLYHVAMYLSDQDSSSTHRLVTVVEYPALSDGVQGLLGWDVLQHCTFLHSKETRLFSLEF